MRSLSANLIDVASISKGVLSVSFHCIDYGRTTDNFKKRIIRRFDMNQWQQEFSRLSCDIGVASVSRFKTLLNKLKEKYPNE